MQLGLFSPQFPEPTRLDVTLARIRAIVGEDTWAARLEDTHRAGRLQIEPFTVPLSPRNTPLLSRSWPQCASCAPQRADPHASDTRPAIIPLSEMRYDVERAYGPWLAGGDWWAQTLGPSSNGT